MRCRAFIFLACLTGIHTQAFAGRVNVDVRDRNNEMMANVVLVVHPTQGKAPTPSPASATVAQKELQFSPYVVAVPVGSQVRFPNQDGIEHHVKSFSPIKEFELKVYSRGTPAPVTFDKPGPVPIHCLLHDWMRAYVYAVDTPWYALTDKTGLATIDVPDGSYEVTAWHPDLGAVRPVLKQRGATAGAQSFTVNFKFDFVPRKQRQPKT